MPLNNVVNVVAAKSAGDAARLDLLRYLSEQRNQQFQQQQAVQNAKYRDRVESRLAGQEARESEQWRTRQAQDQSASRAYADYGASRGMFDAFAPGGMGPPEIDQSQYGAIAGTSPDHARTLVGEHLTDRRSTDRANQTSMIADAQLARVQNALELAAVTGKITPEEKARLELETLARVYGIPLDVPMPSAVGPGAKAMTQEDVTNVTAMVAGFPENQRPLRTAIGLGVSPTATMIDGMFQTGKQPDLPVGYKSLSERFGTAMTLAKHYRAQAEQAAFMPFENEAQRKAAIDEYNGLAKTQEEEAAKVDVSMKALLAPKPPVPANTARGSAYQVGTTAMNESIVSAPGPIGPDDSDYDKAAPAGSMQFRLSNGKVRVATPQMIAQTIRQNANLREMYRTNRDAARAMISELMQRYLELMP